jgi:hypothetical protein
MWCDVRIFGAVIGHLEAEIELWIFHRKWWKPGRAQRFWHLQRFWQVVPPIKAEQPEPSDNLRSTWTRGDTTWTRALQPDLEEVSSWRFCRAPIVSRRITYPPNFLISAEIFTRHGDFNVRLSSIVYCVAHRFYTPPKLSAELFRISLPQNISA